MEIIVHTNFKGELDAEAEILIDKVINIKKELYSLDKLFKYNGSIKKQYIDSLYKKHGVSLRKKDINKLVISNLSEEALSIYNKITELCDITQYNLKNQQILIKKRDNLNKILWRKYRVVVKIKE